MFIQAIAQPTTMSGQIDFVRKVTPAAPMMATLATASLRAERKAALPGFPAWWRWLANRKAQKRPAASAPNPVNERRSGAGTTGASILRQSVQRKARAGASRIKSEPLAQPGAIGRRPTQGQQNQDIDGRVLEEVDRVREKRGGSDPQRHRELHAEIGEVQNRYNQDGARQAGRFHSRILAVDGDPTPYRASKTLSFAVFQEAIRSVAGGQLPPF